MKRAPERLTAPCGLDCTECDIRLVPSDAGAAQRVVDWCHEMGWLQPREGVAKVLELSMYCQGCRGPRAVHWSPNCSILACCVDVKLLRFCSECDTFPCDRLDKWAAGQPSHARALERLRGMRRGEVSTVGQTPEV